MRHLCGYFCECEDDDGVEESSTGDSVIEIWVLILKEEEEDPEGGHECECALLVEECTDCAELIEYIPVLFVNAVSEDQTLNLALEPERCFSPPPHLSPHYLQVLLLRERPQVAHHTLQSDASFSSVSVCDVVQDHSLARNSCSCHDLVDLQLGVEATDMSVEEVESVMDSVVVDADSAVAKVCHYFSALHLPRNYLIKLYLKEDILRSSYNTQMIAE